jgi:DNA-binding beta-propeller fold protein YncE
MPNQMTPLLAQLRPALRKRKWMVIGWLSVIAILGLALLVVGPMAADSKSSVSVPNFQVDPFWPKLPKTFLFGETSGVAVDARDHVWVIQRPESLTDDQLASKNHSDCCTGAPPVMEFDEAGNYIRGWGGPGAGYEWPRDEHGIHVDFKGNVWISSAGGAHSKDEHFVLKFTQDGKFLLQIGHRGKSKGSNDTENFNQAADMYVYPKTNELFVADGYINRRVIVFDADTGKLKRYWGAYGNKPDDSAPRTSGAQGPGGQQFNLVHGVRVANDGLVYVADRRNNRVQVFTTEGKFVKEMFISRDTTGILGTAFAVGFSPDSQQRLMYVADSSNGHVRIVNRDTLEIVGQFGRWGVYAGEFRWLHSLAVDSKGNIYTTEVGIGRRVQKFVAKAGK